MQSLGQGSDGVDAMLQHMRHPPAPAWDDAAAADGASEGTWADPTGGACAVHGEVSRKHKTRYNVKVRRVGAERFRCSILHSF